MIKIEIVPKGVLDVEAQMIVNAANESLLGGGGVDGAIHRAAGELLLEECKSLHGCKTGEVKVTKAYNIKTAQYIAHAVGPIYSGTVDNELKLYSCYKNALDEAVRYRVSSIAFPCISNGVYGYPLSSSIKVVAKALNDFISSHKDLTLTIYLCCYQASEYEIYTKNFQ